MLNSTETTATVVNTEADLPNDADSIQSPAYSNPTAAENEATRKGWVPKDQFTGDPDKWVDAETFIDRGNKFNKNLQKEVERLRKQIEGFEGTKSAFIKFTEERLAAKDAELKEAIAALRVQRSQAVREGDDELAVQLEDRIDVLKEQQKEVKTLPKENDPKSNSDMNDPILMDWIDDGNEWFREDAKLRDYAVGIGNELVQNGENVDENGKVLRGRKFLNLVRQRMEEEFPRRFKKEQKPEPGGRMDPVSGATVGRTSRGGKTEADLPQADRELMDTLVKGGYYTKEKFLQSYFSR